MAKNLYVICGKSSTGKDTIYKRIVETFDGILSPVILHTSREIRSGEKDGVNYHYISKEDFLKKIDSQNMIEYRSYPHTNGEVFYGTSIDAFEDNKSYITINTLEGLKKLKDSPYMREINIHPIYIEVPDMDRIQRALKRESKNFIPNIKECCRRYLADEEEFAEEKIKSLVPSCNRFVNNSLENCLLQISLYITGIEKKAKLYYNENDRDYC